MASKPYNLDDDISESFRFIVKGYEYDMRQMTTEEIDEFRDVKDEKQIREHLYQFITPVAKDTPEFPEIAKKMLAKQWLKFVEMIKVEMTGDNANN